MQAETTEKFHSGVVAIIGRPNVGKSTLLNRILGQKIAITSPKPQTTRNRILGVAHLDHGQILFLDTPGIHQAKDRLNQFMVEQAMSSCGEVDMVLYLIDATSPAPHSATEEKIFTHLRNCGRPVYLVINKIDALSRERLLPIMQTYATKYPFASLVPISAASGDGVDLLVQMLRDALPEGPKYYSEDTVTDLPERFIVAEMVREQLLRQMRDEIPFMVAVVVEEFTEEPERNLVVIKAAINVARDSHKGIVIGKQGAMIRALGQSARRDIEKFLGCRVYLELFVKVQKDWTASERMLREFGYHS